MPFTRIPWPRRSILLAPPPPPPPFHQSRLYSRPMQPQFPPSRQFNTRASLSTEESTSSLVHPQTPKAKWRPMCLYHTHGLCTKMDDPIHIDKFNHSFSMELVSSSQLGNVRAQEFNYFLVLDLEGKVEILEFPVLLVDAKKMAVVDLFHRFVRPTRMTESRINEYIEGKYGNFGVDRVWHDTAIKFEEVIQQFEAWLEKHHFWRKEQGGHLNGAAFVTCGNWDIKTKIPQQCEVSKLKLPPYFMEWINLKDIYLNFYNSRAPGMVSMMRQQQIPQLGSHHLGIDDAKNIARVLGHMLTDGALLQITARRSSSSPASVRFLFQNRI